MHILPFVSKFTAAPASRDLALMVALMACCGGATERGRERSGGELPVPPNAAAAEGGAGTKDANPTAGAIGEGGSSAFDWTCDPRVSEPAGFCRCPNDLCRCDGALACARQCAAGVTLEQVCIVLDEVYLTACRCGEVE